MFNALLLSVIFSISLTNAQGTKTYFYGDYTTGQERKDYHCTVSVLGDPTGNKKVQVRLDKRYFTGNRASNQVWTKAPLKLESLTEFATQGRHNIYAPRPYFEILGPLLGWTYDSATIKRQLSSPRRYSVKASTKGLLLIPYKIINQEDECEGLLKIHE